MAVSMNQQEMTTGMQKLAAAHCAPVICGVKPSNLLVMEKPYAKALKPLMTSTGIKAWCLEQGNTRQIWMLFREEALETSLLDPENRAFMAQFGYTEDMDMGAMLKRMAMRFRQYKRGEIEFPHEVGIFLGYPLEDVKGYIQHKGKDCLCTGYWKVYQNEEKARETFALYNKARDMALDLVNRGLGLGSLPAAQLS